jgi:3-methyl-2-oxobutanoate hydroxymethyltransferase
MKKITVPDISRMKAEGRKIPVLTAYSFPMARILDAAGLPMIIVGDSVGMVEAGYPNTLPVTVDEIIYHTRAVARGRTNALVVSDMPFSSYQVSATHAKMNAARLVKEGGAEAVKLEGGRAIASTAAAIVDMGVPVMGHIGLTPQSVHAMGGFRVQGRDRSAWDGFIEDAREIERSGAFSIVIEGVTAALAKEITDALEIPTIGIGAGPHCDGQVLVLNDMLGLDPGGRAPRYVKKYAGIDDIVATAVAAYIKDVSQGSFPSKEHSY